MGSFYKYPLPYCLSYQRYADFYREEERINTFDEWGVNVFAFFDFIL